MCPCRDGGGCPFPFRARVAPRRRETGSARFDCRRPVVVVLRSSVSPAGSRRTPMRSRPVLLLWSVLALLVPAAAPAAEDKAPAPNLPRLVADLGSDDFARREQATRAPDALGAPALDELRRAAAGDDAEVRRRARELVERIERRVETARLLQPRRVHLIYKNTPVADAVADFARQTGFAIELAGDRAKLNDRKVTLDTGPVPFWEAFDQFCRKAGLVEP